MYSKRIDVHSESDAVWFVGFTDARYAVWMLDQRAEQPLKIDDLAAARRFVKSCFAGTDPSRESLWVAHLDRDAHFLHVSHHDGGPTDAQFPIHNIIADAAIHGSAGVILMHNHPSGDASPSESDRRATRRLAIVAEALNCTVLDHLIVAENDFRSFRQMGLL